MVRGVHERYLAAGARVIETNTFGANAVRLAQHGCENRVSEINWTAAQLAKDVARGRDAYVAGSVGPLGISAAEAAALGLDRHEVFTEQIGALLDGGCQLIFLETFLDPEELLIALEAKQALHHCPIVALLTGNDSTAFQSAATKVCAAPEARGDGRELRGGAADALRFLEGFETDIALAAFPSAGLPQAHNYPLEYSVTPEMFVKSAMKLADRGVRLLGGCCGIGPRHIAALGVALREMAGSR